WWQTGYGAFTVSHSGIGVVKAYIATRRSTTSRGRSKRSSWPCFGSTGLSSTRNTCGIDGRGFGRPFGATTSFGHHYQGFRSLRSLHPWLPSVAAPRLHLAPSRCFPDERDAGDGAGHPQADVFDRVAAGRVLHRFNAHIPRERPHPLLHHVQTQVD